MRSLKIKMSELRAEVERQKRQERDAASARVMAIVTRQFPVDLEPNLCAMSERLLAGRPSDADKLLMAAMPAADLQAIDSTPEKYVVMLATVMTAY